MDATEYGPTALEAAEWDRWEAEFVADWPSHAAGRLVVEAGGTHKVAYTADFTRAFGRWLVAEGRIPAEAVGVLFHLAEHAEAAAHAD